MNFTYWIFIIILLGFVYHRNDEIKLFFCVELLILAMIVDLLLFSHSFDDPDAMTMLILIIIGATAEACIGLAIIAFKYKSKEIEKRMKESEHWNS